MLDKFKRERSEKRVCGTRGRYWAKCYLVKYFNIYSARRKKLVWADFYSLTKCPPRNFYSK